MNYVLDTDILSLLAQKGSREGANIRRRLVELPPGDTVATTIVNYEEQIRGWMALLRSAKSTSAELFAYRRLLEHLTTFRTLNVMPYESAAAEINRNLRARRIRVGTMDLKIAAIVLASDATLITRNTTDFARIPNLRIEDWSAD